jgi:hypothetical protein
MRLAGASCPVWNPRNWAIRRSLKRTIRDLQTQLDRAGRAEVIQETNTSDAASVRARIARAVEAGGSYERTHAKSVRSAFSVEKIEHLERHLQDYKSVLARAIRRIGGERVLFMLDDFYSLDIAVQPDVVDYLHRLVRGLNIYLKLGTIRHRSSLVRQEGQTIGVELHGDVEPIDLDHTLDDLPRTQDFLRQMLDALGKKVGIESVSSEFFNPDALHELTLASGGVARDFLTIFVEAVAAARAGGETRWLTPKYIDKAAYRVSYRTKLSNVRDDLGGEAEPLARAFVDLLQFCLREKKKTLFLISQDEAQQYPEQHELIKQLMDFRLVHIVEPDTSAASGRQGRYEAYTLDFSTFMEPRRRGIEIVKFWETDDQHRRIGLREAPVYPLDRLSAAANSHQDAEAQLQGFEKAIASEFDLVDNVSEKSAPNGNGSFGPLFDKFSKRAGQNNSADSK